MAIKCINCHTDISSLKFSEASVLNSEKLGVPGVLVSLVCPHCSQHYHVQVPVWQFVPGEVKK